MKRDLEAEHFVAIAKSLPQSSLEELILSNNRIGDEGLLRATEYWAVQKEVLVLRVLDVSSNKITQTNSVCRLDMEYVRLDRLMINQNELKSGDLPLPAANLVVLSAASCTLSTDTLVLLATHLGNLQQLTLQNNPIDAEAMSALGAAIPTSNLVKLDLTSCRIRDGLQNFIDALKLLPPSGNRVSCCPLEWVSFKDNALDDDIASEILASLKVNRKVLHFDVDLNACDFKIKRSFVRCCEQNRQRRARESAETYDETATEEKMHIEERRALKEEEKREAQ